MRTFLPILLPFHKCNFPPRCTLLSLHQFSHSMFNSPTLSPFGCRFFFCPYLSYPIYFLRNLNHTDRFNGNPVHPIITPFQAEAEYLHLWQCSFLIVCLFRLLLQTSLPEAGAFSFLSVQNVGLAEKSTHLKQRY